MNTFSNFIDISVITVVCYLLFSALYILIFSIAGHFKIKDKEDPIEKTNLPSIAIFIPAYKEDKVIVPVVKKALTQRYTSHFEIVVIADQLKEETLSALNALPIDVFEVNFEKSTKAKALNLALRKIQKYFDVALILDADNIMENGALNQIGKAFSQGHKVIQGRRTANNLHSDFAFLDGLSEEANNHIYNAGANHLNCSSRLVGSGMAFDYQMFKDLMKNIDVIGGFDKALELKTIEKKIHITYLPEAIIYDEKVGKAKTFGNQRSRWLSAQYQFLLINLKNIPKAVFTGNMDYLVKLYQFALPPRLLFPLITLAMLGLSLLLNVNVAIMMSAISFLIVVVAYGLAIPKKFYSLRLLKVFKATSIACIETLKALFKLKSASKEFIHTPHTGTELNNEL